MDIGLRHIQTKQETMSAPPIISCFAET